MWFFVYIDVLKYRVGFIINIKFYFVCVVGWSNSGRGGGVIDDCVKYVVVK